VRFTYDALPSRVIFGVGAVDQVAPEIDRLQVTRVLTIHGRSERAIASRVSSALGTRAAGVIDEVTLHVPLDVVEAGRRRARDLAADALLAIGGGSATGLAKAIALEQGMPILSIPTTYAGSEMTPIYGITRDGRKATGRDLRVLPRVVIYDPALTTTLPAAVTAGSGMNAIAHAVEGLYAAGANPLLSVLAEEAIWALSEALPILVQEPADVEARTQAMYGAYLAGAVQGAAGMGVHHRICHVLGGTYGLGHGSVNAVILPHAVRFNAEAAPLAIARVAGVLGADDAAVALFDLAERIGAPTSLKALGMPEEKLPEAAHLAAEPPPANPRPVTADSVLSLLRDAYVGRRPVRAAASTVQA
jgi:alcohol dehydrogenase class IV